MIQRGYHSRFLFEPCAEPGRRDLDRHLAVQPCIRSPVDLAHTTRRQK